MNPPRSRSVLARNPHVTGRHGRTLALFLTLLLAAALALTLALAQESSGADAQGDQSQEAAQSERRIITIDGSGGTQRGNLRAGPIIYEHPDPHGVTATVSTLSIFGSYAELAAPEGTSIGTGGQRTASFQNGVLVERGRMTASGPSLTYSEATGLGVLAGPAVITVAAEDEDGELVEILADSVEFDVDTDLSTSSGSVSLTNGNQTATAEQLIYEEVRTLGVFTSAGTQARMTRIDEDGSQMVITADEIRVLTDDKLLYARGNVTVVDGPITSSGQFVFFDDTTGIAEIIGVEGQPARAVDADSGATLTTDRIRQDIEYDFFEAIDSSLPSSFTADAFDLTTEAGR